MLVMEFSTSDLARLRFAISPLLELWMSIGALQCGSAPIHQPWIIETREKVRDLDLGMLYALRPPRGITPDFIHPPPTSPLMELDDELERMLATPQERVSTDLELSYGSSLPPALKAFDSNPREAVVLLAETLRAYWAQAVAPHWDRIFSVLESDVLQRARQQAAGGVCTLFDDIHTTVRFSEQRLEIDNPWDCSRTLDGQGLLLVPSVFIWPHVAVIEEKPWQPTLIYPAQGAALLWEPPPSPSEALVALMGPRRAAVLEVLDVPRSTTELSRLLEIPAGSVSQHLTVLRNAGLVTRRRMGQVVLYRRSRKGDQLES
jgi:DNA-binding transcriptional ArsR family regulator